MTYSTLVINLKHRADRLSKFLQNNISPLEIFPAVMDTLHPNYGCLQSHKAVLELARNRKDQYVFIFEDDAVLNLSFAVLQRTASELEKAQGDWEILLFSVSQGFDTEEYITLPSNTELVGLSSFGGTFSMVVSCRAYDKIINYISSITNRCTDVDLHVYSLLCQGHIYLTLPFMCYVLPDSHSDIRKYDTTKDLEQVKLCQARLLLKTSCMAYITT